MTVASCLNINEYLTIISRERVGYEMIDSQRGALRRVGYDHLISNHEILLDLADFALQEQPGNNLVVAITPAWYSGSYTMAAKPIVPSLEM